MYKCLNLQIIRNICTDLSDLLQRQFSRCNHTGCAKLMPKIKCTVICVIRLRADMTLYLRTNLARNLKNCRICDNERVRFDFFQFLKIFPHAFQIIIVS